MAFMGLVIIALIGSLCMIAVFLLILFLIVGFRKKKKGKKSAKIFFALAAIILLSIAAFGWRIFGPQRVAIHTPDGTVTAGPRIVSRIEEALEQGDTDEMDRILNRQPEFIYYLDHNAEGLLDRAVVRGDWNMAACILDHGAEFDDELTHSRRIYKYSLENYFFSLFGENVKAEEAEISDMVEKMLEHGASVEFAGVDSTPNALFSAAWWVCSDGLIGEDDLAVFRLLLEHGASCTETDSSGQTVMDAYLMAARNYEVASKDPEGFEQAKQLLEICQ